MPNFRKFVYFQILLVYTSTYCLLDQIQNRTQNMLISRSKFTYYKYLNSCSIFKTPITQIAKSPFFCEMAETIIQNLDMGMT